jgi:hypothetical protein
MPQLREVVDNVTIQGAGIQVINLRSLRTVGNTLSIGGIDALDYADLGSLESVNGFSMTSTNGVDEVDLPALMTVGSGGLDFIQNDDLVTVSAPVLTTVGYLIINGHPAMTGLSIGSLTTVNGNFTVTDNPMLPCSDVISAAAGMTITGTTTITGNSGC